MTRERFWQIIEATNAPSQEEQLERFRVELDQLSPQELIEFERVFGELYVAAYTWDLWLVAWFCQGGLCSDDDFAYFRYWLISRGRAVYETGLEDPDALVEEITRAEYPSFELFAYVPRKSYRARTEAEFPELRLQHPKEPAGGTWLRPELKDRTGSKILNLCVVFGEMGDPEFDAIERQFPRVWQYCIGEGIIKLRDSEAPAPAEEMPRPEEVAKSMVDPNLANTDFQAYLKALADAARQIYRDRNRQE